jgi:hypothetical protein
MLISPPEDAYLQQSSRSYYLGHHSNKIRPIIIDEQEQNSQQMIAAQTENLPQHNKRSVSVDAAAGMSSSDSAILGYITDHIVLDDEEGGDLGSTTVSPSYYYFYQPQHLPLSSPSNNNSSITNNTTSNVTAESSSYYSTIPQVESQRTFQSLSTIDSIYTGYKSIQFELPIIRVGMLSHIDASFLQKKVLTEDERQ